MDGTGRGIRPVWTDVTFHRAACSVVAFLLLGAVSTLAVAWLAAGVDQLRIRDIRVFPRTTSSTSVTYNRWEIDTATGPGWRSRSLSANWYDGAADDAAACGPAWSAAHTPPDCAAVYITESEYGWPLRAFASRETYREQLYDGTETLEFGFEIEAAQIEIAVPPPPPPPPGILRCFCWDEPDPAIMPLRPLWCGLIGSTITHAMTWWGLIASWRAVPAFRRGRRRRRGRCVACTYSLVGTPDRCPECGLDARTPRQERPWPIVTPLAMSILIAVGLAIFVHTHRIEPYGDIETPLIAAIRAGDVAAIRTLTAAAAQRADVAADDDDSEDDATFDWYQDMSPVEWAVRGDDVAVLHALLDATDEEYDAISIAIEAGRMGLVQSLLARAGPEWIDENHESMMYAACMSLQDQIVALLIDIGPPPDDELAQSVIDYATPDIVRRVVSRIEDPWDWFTPVSSYAPPGNVVAALDAFDWAEVQQSDVDEWADEMAMSGRSDLVAAILDAMRRHSELDPMTTWRRAMRAALENNNEPATLARLYDLHRTAALPGFVDMEILALIDNWPLVVKSGVMTTLLDLHVDPRVRFVPVRTSILAEHPPIETTVLHQAIRWHDAALARMLVSRGAEINARDGCGRTPIDLALVTDDIHLRESLLEALGR